MTLLRHWLRDAWWILIGYIVILEVALVAAILYWPRFRDNTPQIAKLVPFESLQNLLEAVEIEGYRPYLAIQQWFKGCSLFGLAAAAFLTSGLVARDVDQNGGVSAVPAALTIEDIPDQMGRFLRHGRRSRVSDLADGHLALSPWSMSRWAGWTCSCPARSYQSFL